MEKISLPSKLSLVDTDVNKATLTVEPCFPGYGTTLGNALRRVLLSSVPGAAITAVKIDGVDHQFSAIDGVAQDVVEIILNLKGVRLKVFADEPIKVALSVKGEKKVTAGDIAKDAQVEVMNPDYFIAEITDAKASLSMELTVQKGRGYVPVEVRDKESPEIGTLMIDAIYSPVRSCGFEVESVRVGQMTNYDKLVLTVATDGTLSPKEAVEYAGAVLVDHFTLFQDLDAVPEQPAEEKKEEVEEEVAGEEPVEEAKETVEKEAAATKKESK